MKRATLMAKIKKALPPTGRSYTRDGITVIPFIAESADTVRKLAGQFLNYVREPSKIEGQVDTLHWFIPDGDDSCWEIMLCDRFQGQPAELWVTHYPDNFRHAEDELRTLITIAKGCDCGGKFECFNELEAYICDECGEPYEEIKARRLKKARLELAQRHFERKVAAAIEQWEKKRQEFVADLEKNPVYALEWSRSAFEAAADYQVAIWVKESLQSEELSVFINLATTLEREVINKAAFIEASTSLTSNLMDRYLLLARANWARDLNYYLRALDE